MISCFIGVSLDSIARGRSRPAAPTPRHRRKKRLFFLSLKLLAWVSWTPGSALADAEVDSEPWSEDEEIQDLIDGPFDEESAYLGSSELILDVDTEKLGLWPGGFGRVAAEGRFGDDILADAGSLSPVNNDALFPSGPDREGKDLFALTEMAATQFLALWIGFFGGLSNTTAGDANDYAGFMRSNEYFQNASLVVNPVPIRIVPSVTLGGGLVLIPFDWLVGSISFMNSEESAGSDPFDTNDGVTFATEWTVDHAVGPLSARHVLGFGLGFDNDFFRLGDLPRLELPPHAPPPPECVSRPRTNPGRSGTTGNWTSGPIPKTRSAERDSSFDLVMRMMRRISSSGIWRQASAAWASSICVRATVSKSVSTTSSPRMSFRSRSSESGTRRASRCSTARNSGKASI